MTETTAKRRFYGVGEAKGFTKGMAFQTALSILNGEDVDDNLRALTVQALNYELEGIAAAAERAAANSKSTGEKKDPLKSEYANALRAAILPYIDATPRTATELSAAAAAHGKVSANGKEYPVSWVARVLNAESGVACVKKIVEVVDAKGLKAQREVKAYKRV